jgi:hypothetical protein
LECDRSHPVETLVRYAPLRISSRAGVPSCGVEGCPALRHGAVFRWPYARAVIARVALVLALVAVGLSTWALVRSGGTASAGTCGANGNVQGSVEVTCTGTSAPPSSYGKCTPIGRVSGVMHWLCKP